MHTALTSATRTAFTSALSQRAALSSDLSEDAAFIAATCGQMSAMQYDIFDSAYTIGSSTNFEFLSTFSTFERDVLALLQLHQVLLAVDDLQVAVRRDLPDVAGAEVADAVGVMYSSLFFATISGSGAVAST